MSVANALRRCRIDNNLTLHQVADGVYRSYSAVRSWEVSRTSPSPSDIRSICKFYKITPNQLFDWDSTETDEDILKNIYMTLRGRI